MGWLNAYGLPGRHHQHGIWLQGGGCQVIGVDVEFDELVAQFTD